MSSNWEERLEAVRRELARQDAEWEAAKRALSLLGEVQLRVPEAALAELDAACTVQAVGMITVGAVRG